jgi:NAD(P)-dependent dehydrogenase (short-subunit alcohol dehydrogenase family)
MGGLPANVEIRFDNQAVLVTGANVVVRYNGSPNPAKAVLRDIEAADGEGLLVQADLTQPAPLQAMVDGVLDRLGSIDILINNAGGLVRRSPVKDMPDDVYQYIMDLNMPSTFQMCKVVVPVMKRQGHGNIVNVSSIAARTGGGGGSIVYAASKGAVSTFTHGLASAGRQQHPRQRYVTGHHPDTLPRTLDQPGDNGDTDEDRSHGPRRHTRRMCGHRPIPGLRRDELLRDWPDHRGQPWADHGVKV